MKEYNIGGRIFFVRPLVLGQWKQLINCLATAGAGDPLDALAGPGALAIILQEKGTKIRNKDLAELGRFFEEEEIDGLTTLEVVEDFFGQNDLASFLSKLDAVRAKLQIPPPGSTISSSSSAEETSPKETKSSGDTPSESASDSPSTAAAT